MAATLIVHADGRILEGSPAALELLGMTLQELRSLPPGALSAEPPDPEQDEAFRATWEEAGRPDVGGTAAVRRLDGTKVRVRFALSMRDDGTVLAVLEPIEEPPEAPPTLYTAGGILQSWRAAERHLAEVIEGSDEWAAITEEIERLRVLYQDLFRKPGGAI
jgi:PAS domain S-box-containing protein